MNKLGIFINFWENSWDVDHIKYMKKVKDIGFDILEFQAQPLLEMTNEHMDEMKKAGVAEYTMGSALFNANFVKGGTFRENLEFVLDYLNK